MDKKPLKDINNLTNSEQEEYYRELRDMTDLFTAHLKLEYARQKIVSVTAQHTDDMGLKQIATNILAEMDKIASIHRTMHSALDRKYGVGEVFRTIPERVTVNLFGNCESCNVPLVYGDLGDGMTSIFCPQCKRDYGVADDGQIKTCPDCDGSGTYNKADCEFCRGSGTVPSDKMDG